MTLRVVDREDKEPFPEDILRSLNSFLQSQIRALQCLRDRIDHSFLSTANAVSECRGNVVFTGIGKSGHVGKLLASTYCSLGLSSVFLSSTEALHGDLGVLGQTDLLIAISNSGRTRETTKVVNFAQSNNIKVIGLLGGACPMADRVDISLDCSVDTQAGYLDCAPTSSLITTLSLGQSVALVAARMKGFSTSDFARLHPAGELGKKTSKREQSTQAT
jgi:arabinose-5-phosphate isomerase